MTKNVNNIFPFYLLNMFLFKIINRKFNTLSYKEADKEDIVDFDEIRYKIDNYIMNISLVNIRHTGGQSYNYIQHHFMKYYKYGAKSLISYYDKHQPNTIFEKHFITNNKDFKLPWLHESNNKSNMGEHGLDIKHGHSAYGPVSNKKLKLEMERLDYCLESIKHNGYVVKNKTTGRVNDMPRGYFMVSNKGDWIFRIVGGKHRVAAMAHLGWRNIPVRMQPNYPRCIFENDIENWPGVKSNRCTIEEAKEIFNSYFRDSEQKLWM